jgi:SAM-dependent methyltransferase
MTMPGPALFARLQAAAFYRGLHETAAGFAGVAQGDRTWLDVGCGPGVFARIAAARGFRVWGIDRDPGMIATAERLAAMHGMTIEFAVSDLADEVAEGRRYDVVSASSLVVVTPDPHATLQRLFSLTPPDGCVIVIEAAPVMTRGRALRQWLRGGLGSGGAMLLLWAMARSGRALPDATFDDPRWTATQHPALGGLANVWVLVARHALRDAPVIG